jgi:hypothetical protein
MPDMTLDTSDAAELTELLHFLTDWLVVDHHHHQESLTRFVGGRGYDVDQLGNDLLRFAFLLHGNDGEGLFEPEPQ